MSDIIDIIDGLHAKATKGPVYRSEPSGIIDSSRGVFIAGGTWPHEGALLVELYNAWPAISARLREAERQRDEWKLASSKNGDAMSGYQIRAIVAEQRLEGAKRERDAALASLAEKRRAIDEAFSVVNACRGMLACAEAWKILRPHATKANHSETPKSSPNPATAEAKADEAFNGMSLLDWFAGQATEEDVRHWRDIFLANGMSKSREECKYAYADAMLAARKAGGA